jgi:hypothetical protein
MHYFVFLSTSSKAIDLSSAWLLTGISPHLFDRLRLCIFQTWSVPSKQNLILKQAFPFHPHPPANPQAKIEFSSIVRRVISHLLTQEGTVSGSSSHQYNLLASS